MSKRPKAFESVYTDEQREAVAFATVDRGIRPYRRVVELARLGDLTHNGQKLDPFDITESYVSDLARKRRKARAGQQTSQLAAAPPRDAIEALRRRLVNAADAMLEHLEKQIRNDAGKADPERLRQIMRAVREAAALPGPTDPRPPAPGATKGGKRNGAETKGGMAGSILAAHRGAGSTPAHDAPTHGNGHTETGDAGHDTADETQDAARDAQHDDDSHTAHEDGSPGWAVRERIEAARLAGV